MNRRQFYRARFQSRHAPGIFPDCVLGLVSSLTTARPMSSLIFLTEESQVLVATDTLATSPDGQPFKYTTKAFIVPHLKIIIAGTGTGEFLGRWFVRINEFVVKGIDNLDYHTPGDLASMWRGFKQEFSLADSFTTTVYHFGFSEETGLIHSFAYRSTNNFQSEPIEQYGLRVKPECTVLDNCCLPQDIRKMMDDQRAIQASLPKDQRVYIGGEIQIHHLSKDGFQVYTLHRFEDYDRDEKAIYDSFRAEKNRRAAR
jgi:hypothetical protein